MNVYGATMSNIRDTKISLTQNELLVFSICQLSSEVVAMKNEARKRVIQEIKGFIGDALNEV